MVSLQLYIKCFYYKIELMYKMLLYVIINILVPKEKRTKEGQSGLQESQEGVAHSYDTNFVHLKATEDSDPL